MPVRAQCAVRPLPSLWGVMEREAWIGPRLAPIHIGRCVVIGALGAVTRAEFGGSQFGSPGFGSRRGGGSPRLERFVSEDAKRAEGCQMALDVESVLDGGVYRQEALG